MTDLVGCRIHDRVLDRRGVIITADAGKLRVFVQWEGKSCSEVVVEPGRFDVTTRRAA